jgi:AraC-like DNA-binding protein
MEMAKELLENSSLCVKEIMFELGIADRSHFEREFKKAYRLTPNRYRSTVRLVALAGDESPFGHKRDTLATKQTREP